MRRVLFAAACLLLACLVLAPAGAAGASAKLRVGKVRLVEPRGGPALLVPVSYPIQLAGRKVTLRVTVNVSGTGTLRTWRVRARTHAGKRRTPEKRKRFSFVHTVPLSAATAMLIRNGDLAMVHVNGNVDVDGDGRRELTARDRSLQPLTRSAAHRICGSLPQLRVHPGARIAVDLPPCAGETRWALPTRTERGKLRLRGGRLIYRAPKKFRGTVSATLMAAPAPGIPASRRTAPAIPVQITVGSAKGPTVRALGDSVTAGFGYYEHGEPMGITSLLSCRPGETSYDDACSSNSKVRSNKAAKVEYASDYGLSNNVSWVAQWANAHGVTDFKNFAVSGSEPSDWYGKGQFAATTKQLIGENPDYVLLTMGANPLLSNMLFGIGNIGCGIWADVTGRFKQCIEEEFAAIKLQDNLRTLYTTLVKGTSAEIFVMQYHLSIPTAALYGVEQIAQMGVMMNEEIAKAARAVSPARITVVSPPHFNVGLSLGQVYPSKYRCEGDVFTSIVDGRSVQSTISQDTMEGLHPIDFCPAEEGEEPWVISGDTGIHPSADGYTQMAAKVPPPK